MENESVLSVEVVEKPNKCKSFLAPNFFREGWPQLFYGTLLERPTVDRLTKCGWVPFVDLCLRSLAMKQNAEFTEGG